MSEPDKIEFEAALAELEQIVEALERGGPDLKGALAGYGRGVALLGHCQAILDHADRSVALLTGVDDNGRAITTPFDSAATASSPQSVAAPMAVNAVPVPVAVAADPPVSTPTRKPSPTPPPVSAVPEAPF